MKDLIYNIAKAIIDNPEEIEVSEEVEEDLLTVKINVAPSDMGKIIGKQGRIANAIRTVARAAGTKNSQRVHVEIVD